MILFKVSNQLDILNCFNFSFGEEAGADEAHGAVEVNLEGVAFLVIVEDGALAEDLVRDLVARLEGILFLLIF